MHRSSESIGAIAAALAKAQVDLSNPEKSLVATIQSPSPRDAERTFRYAPLSSGLDIVRKSLGKHEIATVQTTAIDAESGLVRLTTVLAHSSGEWISSEWPVCPVSETATPHRMGAALTYARRYALFTLVGIAGEDDLDAPDTGPAKLGNAERASVPVQTLRKPGNGFDRKPSAPVLPTIESAAARDKLIGELGGIASADQLTTWAARQMTIKNTLSVDDARAVEAAFQARLEQVIPSEVDAVVHSPTVAGQGTADVRGVHAPGWVRDTSKTNCDVAGQHPDAVMGSGGNPGNGIDKSVLAIGEVRRYRDKAHLKFVALQACLVCGRQPSDPHHLRSAQPRALGRKVSDEFAVPLCRVHHREAHQSSNEAEWWKAYGLNPLTVASALWVQTRPLRSVAHSNTPAATQNKTAELLSKTRRNRKINRN
jgi:hypothetical protein